MQTGSRWGRLLVCGLRALRAVLSGKSVIVASTISLARKLSDESDRLMALIQNEREKRERMQNSMLQILEDLSVKHEVAIKNEKKEREATEELLLKVLETSLTTIERGF